MKSTNILKWNLVLLCAMLFSFSGLAQEKNKKESFKDQLEKEIKKAVKESKPDYGSFIKEPCVSEVWLASDVKAINEDIRFYGFENSFFYDRGVQNIEKTLEDYGIDKGLFKTRVDKFLNAYSSHPDFGRFYTELTGNDFGDDSEKQVQYIRSIRDAFKEFFETKYFLTELSERKSGDCKIYGEIYIEFSEYKYPSGKLDVIISYTKNCSCDVRPGKLKRAKGEIKIPIVAIHTAREASITRVGKAAHTVTEVNCCPLEETSFIPDPESFIQPEDTTGYVAYPGTFATDTSGVVPNYLIGASAGLGYFDQSEEFSACAGAQYLKPISEGNRSYTSLGGRLNFNTAFTGGDTDFSQTTVSGGPVIEWGSKHKGKGSYGFTGGLGGNYTIGTRDSSGFKDDIRGYNIGAYGGLRADFEKGSLNVQLDFFNYTNTTFENEQGEEFDSNSFTATIFKQPSVHVIYRWHR